jgi:hypothetical protein
MIKKQSESDLQSLCVKWFRIQYPNYKYRLFAIPNGGLRNIRTAVRLKREGVLAGVPDLFLAVPKLHYGGLFIELKNGNSGKLTDHQKLMISELGASYMIVIVKTFEEFKKTINDYL